MAKQLYSLEEFGGGGGANQSAVLEPFDADRALNPVVSNEIEPATVAHAPSLQARPVPAATESPVSPANRNPAEASNAPIASTDCGEVATPASPLPNPAAAPDFASAGCGAVEGSGGSFLLGVARSVRGGSV